MKLMVLHEGTLIMDAELQSDAHTNSLETATS